VFRVGYFLFRRIQSPSKQSDPIRSEKNPAANGRMILPSFYSPNKRIDAI
jgi:hypothetical protein